MTDETKEPDLRHYHTDMSDEQIDWFVEHVEILAKAALEGFAEANGDMVNDHNAPSYVADDVIINAALVVFITVFSERMNNSDDHIKPQMLKEMIESLTTRIMDLTGGGGTVTVVDARRPGQTEH